MFKKYLKYCYRSKKLISSKLVRRTQCCGKGITLRAADAQSKLERIAVEHSWEDPTRKGELVS